MVDRPDTAPPAHAWRRMLELSTGHLCERTRARMDDWTPDTAPVSMFAPHTYGWMMFVPTDGEMCEDVPPDLREVLAYAARHGAEYLLLDADVDADDVEALPSYDHGNRDDMPDGYLEWEAQQAIEQEEDEIAEAEARLDALETAFLNGEIAKAQWQNGGA